MNKGGPIIIIEDDPDDLDLFADVFKELNNPNEVIYFKEGISALEYLICTKDQAFIIISDINLPKLDGCIEGENS